MRSALRSLLLAVAIFAACTYLTAQLPPQSVARIDAIANQALADTGTPSASLAAVQGGKIVYLQAYGNGRLTPSTTARPEMRYSIGSVSKQFLAGAILLLQQDRKLSLDDRVGRYLPALTRANDITIRQLLSHTSGYQDYYPLDYVTPAMQRPITADDILNLYAKKPLDFEPGTDYQYSNTNYVVAGRILEMVSGVPLMTFLRSRIFAPLGMESPIDLDHQALTEADAAGYTHFGLGPARPVAPEGRGWLFAAGELAMTASDLGRWDQALIQGTLLKPASLVQMMTPVSLKNGAPGTYGLGQAVSNSGGHPRLAHGGAVAGFVSNNSIWLDQGVAVAVLTNRDGSGAASSISGQVGRLLLADKADPEAAEKLAQARNIFADLQEEGKIDRSQLTADCDAYFTAQILADAAASLKPLGAPESFDQAYTGLRGGMRFRGFTIKFASGKSLNLTTYAAPDGKLAQYLIQ